MPTRFARLTAAGRSAVATVAVFGPAASEQVCQYFRPASGKSFGTIPFGQIVFGRWISVRGTTEELVVCRLHENRIDVHCHGGNADVFAHEGAKHSDYDHAMEEAHEQQVAADAEVEQLIFESRSTVRGV